MPRTTKVEKVTYPDIQVGGKPLVAERVRYGREILVARGAQRLLRTAYARQLELPTGPLPQGSIRRHLANENNPLMVVGQAARMRHHMNESDSAYWVVRDPEQRGHLLALAKTTEREGGVYVNDVLSAQEHEGYGSAVLHSALGFSGYDRGAPVELDGFSGSSVNNWFEDMGLHMDGHTIGGFDVGPNSLNQVSYVGANVGHLTTYMATQHLELEHYIAG